MTATTQSARQSEPSEFTGTPSSRMGHVQCGSLGQRLSGRVALQNPNALADSWGSRLLEFCHHVPRGLSWLSPLVSVTDLPGASCLWFCSAASARYSWLWSRVSSGSPWAGTELQRAQSHAGV